MRLAVRLQIPWRHARIPTHVVAIQLGNGQLTIRLGAVDLRKSPITNSRWLEGELGFSSSSAMPSHHKNTRALAPWQQSLALLVAG